MAILLIFLSIAVVVLGISTCSMLERLDQLNKETVELRKSVNQINNIIVNDWKSKVIPFNRGRKK